MTIPSNYTINISKLEKRHSNDAEPRYYHYCRIELPEYGFEDAKKKYLEICKLFDGSMGFKRDLEHNVCYTEHPEV